VLVALLATDPVPVFAFLSDYDSLADCEKAGKALKIDDADRERIGCIAIARDSV